MYQKKTPSWIKHLDFEIIDILCMEICFGMAYVLRHHGTTEYLDSIYLKMGLNLFIINWIVIFFFQSYKDILIRNKWQECIAVFRHVTIVYMVFLFYEYLIKEAKSKTNIEFEVNQKIEKLNEKDGVLESIETNKQKYEVKCLFIAIGQTPQLIKIDGLETEDNYIIVNQKMETSIKNIYACGDAIKKQVYQLTTAAAEGTIAAENIIRK